MHTWTTLSIVLKVTCANWPYHMVVGVSITLRVDLMQKTWGDLFTRVSSNVRSDGKFYTDSNSFSMLERTNHYPERPIASNYYPITSALYVQGLGHRLSLLSAQPLGMSGLATLMEIIAKCLLRSNMLFVLQLSWTGLPLVSKARYSIISYWHLVGFHGVTWPSGWNVVLLSQMVLVSIQNPQSRISVMKCN